MVGYIFASLYTNHIPGKLGNYIYTSCVDLFGI